MNIHKQDGKYIYISTTSGLSMVEELLDKRQ